MNKPAEVIEQLDGLRMRWWLFSTLCTFAMAAIASLLLLTLLVLLDLLFALPRLLLLAALVLWCGGTLLLVAAVVLRSVRRQHSLEAAAHRVELTFPELENNLISLVQWDELPEPVEGFQRAAIEEAARRAADVPIESTSSHQDRKRRWQLAMQTPRDLLEVCSVLAVELALLGLLSQLPSWSRSTDRLWSSFVPSTPASNAAPAPRDSSSNIQAGGPAGAASGEFND